MSLAEELAQGAAALRLDLDALALQRLLDYLKLILKWNRVYNLTAVRDERMMVSQHLLDCLAVAPHMTARSIVDVGSGAGLPGIPLALALPQSRVVLLEANRKKAAFLRQAAIELKLANAEVACARAESWRPAEKFGAVISRAFSSLADFVAAAGHLCAADGVLAAMKGIYPHEELAQLPHGFRLCEVIRLVVPGLDAQRHLVLMEPV
ncbi:MAG: 16S rRNA (guanine(527)-N(7))-methyltransferase RsmG [Burkholderiales bacterium]|nr:16S rRNA (guanine(527)-N(7))-methyltransferase RsmG [Burkholderiales bacterium]